MRAATFDDLPALVALSRCYHAEAHNWLPFDEKYVAENFRVKTIDTMDGICLVTESDAAITGYLAATVSMFFPAPVRLAVELAWYVHQDHRGRGGELLDEYENWARFKNCVACSFAMPVFENRARNMALERFYKSRDYLAYERGFLKVF